MLTNFHWKFQKCELQLYRFRHKKYFMKEQYPRYRWTNDDVQLQLIIEILNTLIGAFDDFLEKYLDRKNLVRFGSVTEIRFGSVR